MEGGPVADGGSKICENLDEDAAVEPLAFLAAFEGGGGDEEVEA